MDFNYIPVHRLKFNFSSEDLIHIRVTVNGIVKVVQCRSSLDFVAPINMFDRNSITIENLTNNIACNIDSVWLNYLNITPAVHEFTKTYTKSDKNQIGDFVSDIFSPDICDMQFDIRLYKKLMPYFRKRII
jgi:hypothetical protein